jgi:putative membrane protein
MSAVTTAAGRASENNPPARLIPHPSFLIPSKEDALLKRFGTLARSLAYSLVLLAAASRAFAQTTERARTMDPATLLNSVLSTTVFGLLGIVLTIIGFKLFDMATPFHLEKEVCENKNMAVAIVCGAMMLGISIIVAMTIHS